MKIYSLTGYLIIFSYMLACMYFAPTHLGPWTGMLIGGVYFVFCWFLGGLYLADVQALKSSRIGIATATCRSEGFPILTHRLVHPNVRGATSEVLYRESRLVHV
jgi:hypothetical protein